MTLNDVTVQVRQVEIPVILTDGCAGFVALWFCSAGFFVYYVHPSHYVTYFTYAVTSLSVIITYAMKKLVYIATETLYLHLEMSK